MVSVAAGGEEGQGGSTTFTPGCHPLSTQAYPFRLLPSLSLPMLSLPIPPNLLLMRGYGRQGLKPALVVHLARSPWQVTVGGLPRKVWKVWKVWKGMMMTRLVMSDHYRHQ